MNIKKYIAAAATIVVAVAAFFSMTSCKGRTMENMEPLGETVEVVVEAPVVVADSVQP